MGIVNKDFDEDYMLDFIFSYIYRYFESSDTNYLIREMIPSHEEFYKNWLYYKNRHNDGGFVMNIKGRGFPEVEDVEKARGEYPDIVIDSFKEKFEGGYFEEEFWDDVSYEMKCLSDDFDINLYSWGRSGGYWGFSVEEIKKKMDIFVLDEEKIRDMAEDCFKEMVESDKIIEDEIDARNFIDNYIDGHINLADAVGFSKEFTDLLDEAEKEIEGVIFYFENDYIFGLLDRYYENNTDSFKKNINFFDDNL